MNRRSIFAVFGTALAAVAQTITTKSTTSRVVRHSGDGPKSAHQLADPQNQWNRILWTDGGKALNNQCPVCGTMAEPREVQYTPTSCRPVGGNLVACDKEPIPYSDIVRCRRCNAAFWQDAEEPRSK